MNLHIYSITALLVLFLRFRLLPMPERKTKMPGIYMKPVLWNLTCWR